MFKLVNGELVQMTAAEVAQFEAERSVVVEVRPQQVDA